MPAIQDISAQTFSLHAVAYNLLYAFNYSFIKLESVFMHQTTSYNQKLKDNLKELKGA